jgi:hypothetical protein
MLVFPRAIPNDGNNDIITIMDEGFSKLRLLRTVLTQDNGGHVNLVNYSKT